MTTQLSNEIRLLTANKEIDYGADVFKIALMESGFTFNPVTHDHYADISASELSTGNGYTAGGATMAGVAVARNDGINLTEITWNDVQWTASGGTIGATPGAILYNDTETDKVIVGYIDFGGDRTEPDGGIATISNPIVRI